MTIQSLWCSCVRFLWCDCCFYQINSIKVESRDKIAESVHDYMIELGSRLINWTCEQKEIGAKNWRSLYDEKKICSYFLLHKNFIHFLLFSLVKNDLKMIFNVILIFKFFRPSVLFILEKTTKLQRIGSRSGFLNLCSHILKRRFYVSSICDYTQAIWLLKEQ